MNQIVDLLESMPLLSIREIALGLGLRKSPYLREMLIELIGQEKIVYQWRDRPGEPQTMVFRVFVHPDDPAIYDDPEYSSGMDDQDDDEPDNPSPFTDGQRFPHFIYYGK